MRKHAAVATDQTRIIERKCAEYYRFQAIEDIPLTPTDLALLGEDDDPIITAHPGLED